MNADMIKEQLEPWIARQRRPAWTPIVAEEDGEPTSSKFCGTPWIDPGAPWPDCGHCKRPLSLFLQLDLDSLPAELEQRFGSGLLQLFYCTRGECQGFGGWEPFADDLSRVRIVRPTSATHATSAPPSVEALPARQIVGWNRFLDLPSLEEHGDLGLTYTYDFNARTLRLECPELGFALTNPMNDCPAEQIANSTLGDKLAGWPAWIQGVEYPVCPQCQRTMVHVFQVDSEDHIPFMFGDAGCGHITQCPEHKEVVAFGWACS